MEKADLERSSSSSRQSPADEKVLDKDVVRHDDVTNGLPPDPDEGLSAEERSKIVCKTVLADMDH